MKTRTKFKSLVSVILAVLMLASIATLTAFASQVSAIDIEFYKPAGWADTIKIHIWNAQSGNTQWPGVDMEALGNGRYRFRDYSIGSCDFVIHDNTGNQTADLHANGSVSVKDGVVVEKADEPMRFSFKKPEHWSSDVKVYFYTDDENEVAFHEWPGVAMSPEDIADTYYYNTSQMKNARVIFTDGTNQYPASGQPGIPVSEGQELLFDDGKYTVNDYHWLQVSQPTNKVYVNNTAVVRVETVPSDAYTLYFFDETGAIVEYDSVTQTTAHGKKIREYAFTFSSAGQRTLDIKYYYHSSFGSTGLQADINVIEENFKMLFTSSDYDLTMGQQFTLKADYVEELTYTVFDDNGNQITPVRTYQAVDPSDGHNKVHMVFSTDQIGLGQFQKLHLYMQNWRNPFPVDTGAYVMVDVWQAVTA